MATLKPVDERFFSTAPLHYVHTWTIPKPAEEVWADLVSDRPLSCIPRLTLRWTSPRPLGVGATRRATCAGLLKLDEYYFTWDEGRRYTFFIYKSSLPTYRSFAEDYLVEPLGADRCQFTFHAAGDPRFMGRLGGPFLGRFFSDAFDAIGRHFNALASSQHGQPRPDETGARRAAASRH